MSRIALVLPVAYRGGSLRAARDLALKLRAATGDTPLQVVFARPAGPAEADDGLANLREAGIDVRPIVWRHVDRAEADSVCRTAARRVERPIVHDRYCYPSDGLANLLDCDFWLFFSDRVTAPLLPLRPYGVIVFDCLQRYVPEIMTDEAWAAQPGVLVPFVREADLVLVTTPVTAADVRAFHGVPRARVREVPLFYSPPAPPAEAPSLTPYLVWPTNRSRHKNHLRTLRGLERYYDEHGGRLETMIVGTETDYFAGTTPHPVPVVEEYVSSVRKMIAGSPALRRRVRVAGEVSDRAYVSAVAGARLLLHSCLYDNGAFPVLDAAALGVPVLSARYPAMEHLDRRFDLGLAWFDPYDPDDLAGALRAIEQRLPAIGVARDRVLPPAPDVGATLRHLLVPWLGVTA